MRNMWHFDMEGSVGVLRDRDGREHVVRTRAQAARIMSTMPLMESHLLYEGEAEAWGACMEALAKSSLPEHAQEDVGE